MTASKAGACDSDSETARGSIRRAPRPENGWFPVRNELARDERLSYRARGLLVAILSKPDGWRIDLTQLAREGKEGRDAVRSALRELEEAGYLCRRSGRSEKGHFRLETIVYDVSQPPDQPSTGQDIGAGQKSQDDRRWRSE